MADGIQSLEQESFLVEGIKAIDGIFYRLSDVPIPILFHVYFDDSEYKEWIASPRSEKTSKPGARCKERYNPVKQDDWWNDSIALPINA